MTGGNTNATKEAGEPNHAGNPGGRSVWWSWTPANSGTAMITTSNSSFDTILGVYTGTAVNALSFVAADDDSGGNGTSRVTFTATSGVTYSIAVDGYNNTRGSIRLNLSQP